VSVTTSRTSETVLPGNDLVVVPRQDSPADNLRVVRHDEKAPATWPAAPVLLVGSSGGHLAQLLSLRPWWADKPHRWVMFNTPDARAQLAGESVVWAHHPTTRNIPNLVRNTLLALMLLLRSRPSVIVSTGAGVALPFFVLGKLLGIPTVYVEVYDRVDSRTMTGRLCRPFATRFLVQWQEQLPLYRESMLLGPLL